MCDYHGPEARRARLSVTGKRPSEVANPGHLVRRATPAHAQAISALYIRVYTPAGGGDPCDYYPFPQLMNADLVAAMIESSEVLWLVGEAPNGILAGAAGAVRNIGDSDDRIAEIFGVAVDARHRQDGLGSALVGGLVDELAGSEFILLEARTENAGGWKVARKIGFLPIGYEPYAHAMPSGYESMVLSGRWHHSAYPEGLDGQPSLTAQAHKLREAVLGLPPRGNIILAQREQAEDRQATVPDFPLNVRRDDTAAPRWFGARPDIFDRSAGVVGLNPLLGMDDDGGRFTRACYLACSRLSEQGAARVIYDRVDARARILGLRAAVPQVRAALLQYLVDDLLRLADNTRLVIIVLVASTCSDLQTDLVKLGFFPTAYLPGFIATPAGRGDVVQFTRLAGCSLLESTKGVTPKRWPEAERIIAQVLGFGP